MKLYDGGVYLLDGEKIIPDSSEAPKLLAREGCTQTKEQARRGTIAWSILHDHNQSGDDEKLRIRFMSGSSRQPVRQDLRSSLFRMCLPTAITHCVR